MPLSKAEVSANVDRYVRFIYHRETLRMTKEDNASYPWSSDSILNKYRFCNVDRNDDTVTKWIHENISVKGNYHTLLWLHFVAARVFNNPDALKDMGFLIGNLPLSVWKFALTERKRKGLKNFNAAYIVSTNGISMDKLDYVFDYILEPMYASGGPKRRPTLCSEWETFFRQFRGMGDFMINQVVTDMRYSHYLRRSIVSDWSSWVLPGPGTKRGLNRIFNGDVKETMAKNLYRSRLSYLQDTLVGNEAFQGTLDHLWETFYDPNNVSNCLCEFDKYERCRLGEGTPKQLYHPKDT